MKISQFKRASEIIESLKELDTMRINLCSNIDKAFVKYEDDPNSYSYNKKQIEVKIYPQTDGFALLLQKELVEKINTAIEAEKNKLTTELDSL